ncbi:MAG: hypothetical protein Q7R70_00810 [Candidatus Diapherotrites archaeon]|nr:hypothetical protein [Candidatus Diapherotrites archaeon]
MNKFQFLLISLLILSFFAVSASSANYQCVFKNQGQVNCNAVNAGQTFCKLAMTITGTATFGNNTSCTNNTPGQTGSIVCQVSHSGPANQVRCSNTTYLESGPVVVGGQAPSCSYNDCALNQVSCASAFAFQKCVPDSSSPGCNKWQATNCVANAPCNSQTTTQLATCMGVQASQISSQNGVFFFNNSQPVNDQPKPAPIQAEPTDCKIVNGKTYCVVSSTDSSKNTGNKVCKSFGKTCVGYTDFSNESCKSFHPTASATTSVNGSKAGFYCNGPPQTGLACEKAANNCQVCPACNVNADCDYDISGFFREMFVECSSGDSSSFTVPSSIIILGDGVYDVIYKPNSGADQKYFVKIINQTVVSTSPVAQTRGTITITENAVNAISKASDQAAEAKNQLKSGGITVQMHDFIAQIQWFFFKFFI